MSARRPFDAFPGAGRQLLGHVKTSGRNCRRDYGPPVFQRCGARCVYCGVDLNSSYERWLHISVDHVVPELTIGRGWPAEWVRDAANLVTCCRTCNELLNDFYGQYWPRQLPDRPTSLAAFFEIRDRFFDEKLLTAQERQRAERERYVGWLAGYTARRATD